VHIDVAERAMGPAGKDHLIDDPIWRSERRRDILSLRAAALAGLEVDTLFDDHGRKGAWQPI
jgi:hypothetical protein